MQRRVEFLGWLLDFWKIRVFLHQLMDFLISCYRSTIIWWCNLVLFFAVIYEPEIHLMNSVNKVDMFAV